MDTPYNHHHRRRHDHNNTNFTSPLCASVVTKSFGDVRLADFSSLGNFFSLFTRLPEARFFGGQYRTSEGNTFPSAVPIIVIIFPHSRAAAHNS